MMACFSCKNAAAQSLIGSTTFDCRAQQRNAILQGQEPQMVQKPMHHASLCKVHQTSNAAGAPAIHTPQPCSNRTQSNTRNRTCRAGVTVSTVAFTPSFTTGAAVSTAVFTTGATCKQDRAGGTTPVPGSLSFGRATRSLNAGENCPASGSFA